MALGGGSQKDSHDIIIVSFVITLTGRRATPKLYKCTSKGRTYLLQAKNILIAWTKIILTGWLVYTFYLW